MYDDMPDSEAELDLCKAKFIVKFKSINKY